MRQIGIADLRRAYDAAYQPDNATIVVTGDVDPVPVVAKIDALFGGIRGHATLAPRPLQRPVVPGATVRIDARAERLVDLALTSHGYLGPHGIAEEIAIALLQPEHRALRDPLVERGPCNAYEADDERTVRCRMKNRRNETGHHLGAGIATRAAVRFAVDDECDIRRVDQRDAALASVDVPDDAAPHAVDPITPVVCFFLR